MKKWLFTLLLLIVYPVLASHIVGGEFELLHLSGNKYQLNLIIYFDVLHGSPAAKDVTVTASIYRKSDKALMTFVTLPLVSETPVGYTVPACATGQIVTNKLFYTTDITLDDATYSDPGGYFVVWQRCCRNYQITNIVSDAPPDNDPNFANAAGQTFYLEFPPVVKNGVPFFNSSPQLFPPLNDFASPFVPYYVNFAGIDVDGDSLVYSLVVPWSTIDSESIPPSSPGPFPLIQWRPGFGPHNILDGAPDLHISTQGFLTCTPTVQGLFVFAVQVLQFRNKVQIGLSRRDFQMLVVEAPRPEHPPHILGIDAAGATHQPRMSVSFANTVADADRCVQVQVSDPDSQSSAYNFTETVTIRAIPLNFHTDELSSILPSVTVATLRNGSTQNFSICFPQCPFFNGPMEIGIIAYDQSCSLPLLDTLILTVNIQPPPNSPPYFTTPTPVNAVLNEGEQGTWPFAATDPDLDSLIVYLITDGFVLADAGMTFTTTTNQKGSVAGNLHWDAFCNIYDFTKRTSFQVTVKVDDADKCNFDDPILAVYNLSVKLPGVADPVISVNPTSYQQPGLMRQVGQSLSFDVSGTQIENDYLVLREIGAGLLVKAATFPATTGTGSVASHFGWGINCKNVNLNLQDNFAFQFILMDTANWCRFVKIDTATVLVKVLPPDNTTPTVVIEDLSQNILPDNSLSVVLGQPIALNILGSDPDTSPEPDSLVLNLVDATGNVIPVGYSFKSASGENSVVSPFTWNPECNIFKDGVYKNDYVFKFSVYDNRCFNGKGDTVLLNLSIHDVSNEGREFLPGNIITPDGDGCNDYFAVEGIDPGCGNINPDETVALPFDNCAGQFQLIRIRNRWGKLVFESTAKNFRWYATNESAGIYYYLIDFTNSKFKGIITVR